MSNPLRKLFAGFLLATASNLNQGQAKQGQSRKCMWVVIIVMLLTLLVYGLPVAGAASKLTFMGYTANFGPELQEAFSLFTTRTGIAIEVVPVVSWPDLNAKIITMSAAGVAPDVIYGDDLRIFAFAEQKLLQPLDALITRDKVNMRVYPVPVVEGLKVRGGLYSLPTAVSINGLFYNTDLFDKFGQRYLPTNWSTAEFGWDDFTTLARKLTYDTNGDDKPEQYGLHGFGSYGGFNLIGLWNAEDIDRDRTRYNGNDPKVIRALTQIMSLYTEHMVAGGNFLTGTGAMHTVQSYYVNNIRTQMANGSFFSWKIGVLPKVDTRVSQGAFVSMGIGAGSSNKEDAWKLIRFLAYDPEGALLFTRAENRTPVLKETMKDYLQRWSQLIPGCNLQVFTDATQVIWRWNLMSGFGATEIGSLLNSVWANIKKGQVSVSGAVAQITPQIQSILDDSRRN